MAVFELRIFDKSREGKQTLSLLDLFRAIDEEKNDVLNGRWYIQRGAWGFGSTMDAIEHSLRSRNEMPVNVRSLYHLMLGGREELNEAHFRKEGVIPGERMELGVNRDERYLFAISDNEMFLRIIAAAFRDTKIDCIAGLDDN